MAPHAMPDSDGEVPLIDGASDCSPVTKFPITAPELLNDISASVHEYKPNGTDKTSGDDCEIPMHDQLAFTPRKIRVITVGAGFSGLMVAHKFQHRYPEMQDTIEHKIFEANNDIGGTWLVNTYPGVQCDVPSHIYAFPFDPNPEWTRFYSSGKEIHDYIKKTAKKWDLDRDVQLSSKVTSAVWQEELGRWKVTVQSEEQTREEYAEVLISAQGALNTIKWPEIPGLETFKGHRVHSGNWIHDYDYNGKRIAVIGNGSSGIQIVPQMAKLPGTTVMNFARGTAWIYYRVPPSQHLKDKSKGNNPPYTEEQKYEFRKHPEAMRDHRKAMIARTNKAFRMFIKGSDANKEAMRTAGEQMAERLGYDKRLCQMLIPDWQLGCRRITPGEGYLEAFLLPNCDITNSPITNISEHAVHTADGKVHEVDVVVCATGFDVSFRPHYPTIGRDGVDLRAKWGSAPESYFSVAAADMPNYFVTIGPNALAGHGSLLEALNWNTDYYVKWLKKISEEDIHSVVPKTEVVRHLVSYGDEIHKTLVWTGDCKSWYKRGTVDGRVTALFAGSGMLYKRLISDLRPEDFNIRYRSSNTFKFLGNGFTAWELDPNSDLSWYIEK